MFGFFLTLLVNNYKGVLDCSSVTSRVVSLKRERRMIQEIEIPELLSTLSGLCMVVTSVCPSIKVGDDYLPHRDTFVYCLVIFIHVRFSIHVLSVTTLGTR